MGFGGEVARWEGCCAVAIRGGISRWAAWASGSEARKAVKESKDEVDVLSSVFAVVALVGELVLDLGGWDSAAGDEVVVA